MRLARWSMIAMLAGSTASALSQESTTRPALPDVGLDHEDLHHRQIQEFFEHIRRDGGRASIASHREKGAYLGISSRPAPAILRKHLDLKNGEGLIVLFVDPKSPAADAGIVSDDILLKLNDQILVNQDQLAVLVRMQKPGDEISLTAVHDGHSKTLKAKLVERDLEPLPEPLDLTEVPVDIERMIPEPRVHRLPQRPKNAATQGAKGGPASVSVMGDGDQTITITSDVDGHRNLIAKDRTGKTIFEGPVDTAAQRNKLPADIRQRLDELDKLMENLKSFPPDQ